MEDLENLLRETYIQKTSYRDVRINLLKVQQIHSESIFDSKAAIKEKYNGNSAVIISLGEEEEASTVKYFRNGSKNQWH